MKIRAVALVTLVVAGCAPANGTDSPTEPPTKSQAPPNCAVRVVNLNAAMGYHAGSGDPAGTDATPEDLDLLAGDILGQDGDIANLQEMALPAARQLREVLGEKTGDEWQLNWAHAAAGTFYAGRSAGEPPVFENVSAGNAQLVRIGGGVEGQRPITLDEMHDDQGILLPAGARSFMGAEITTCWGAFDVYNTHLPLADQASDADRRERPAHPGALRVEDQPGGRDRRLQPGSSASPGFYAVVAFRRRCGCRGGLWLGAVTFP